MIKRLLIVLTILLTFVPSPCRAEEGYPLIALIERYRDANLSGKVEIANQIFANRFQDQIDTLITFDERDPVYLDAMMYYSCAYDAYEIAFDYEHAALWCQQAELLSQHCDSTFLYGDCLALASCIYIRLSDFSQAIEYAERSLEFDRQSGDPAKISSSLNNAAAIYTCANRPQDAERYMIESMEYERQNPRPMVLSSRLGLASEIFIQSGKYQQALAYAEEALQLAQIDNNSNRIAMRQSQLGLALFHAQRYEEARAIMLEAVDTLAFYRNKNSLSITYRQLASLEQTVGAEEKAIEYLKLSLDISRQIGNKMHITKEYKQLAELLRQRDPSQAFSYLEEYVSLNEAIYDDKMAMQLQSFNIKYQTAEIKHQLELQKGTLFVHRVMIIVAVIVLVVLLFAVFTLFRLAKARGKTNQILSQANAAKDELIRIATEERLQAESARQQILEVAEHISSLSAISEEELTSREIQVIRLYSKGLVSKEIADQLNISVRTVETHKNHIYKKLGISTTVELLRFAQQKGII